MSIFITDDNSVTNLRKYINDCYSLSDSRVYIRAILSHLNGSKSIHVIKIENNKIEYVTPISFININKIELCVTQELQSIITIPDAFEESLKKALSIIVEECDTIMKNYPNLLVKDVEVSEPPVKSIDKGELLEIVKDGMSSCIILSYEKYKDAIDQFLTDLVEWYESAIENSLQKFKVCLLYNSSEIVTSLEYRINTDEVIPDRSMVLYEKEFKYLMLLEEGLSTNYGVGIYSKLHKIEKPLLFINVDVTFENIQVMRDDLFIVQSILGRLIKVLFNQN